MDYRTELLGMVARLIDGSWDVPTFEKAYYDFYVSRVPDCALTDREHEFFGFLQERLDWTDAAPDVESRRYGWQNHVEYRAWAAELLLRFQTDEPLAPPPSGTHTA